MKKATRQEVLGVEFPSGNAETGAEKALNEGPTIEQLEHELKLEQKKHFWTMVVRNTLFFLSVVAAVDTG